MLLEDGIVDAPSCVKKAAIYVKPVQVFQAAIDSNAGAIAETHAVVNNVLLGLGLARFLKEATQ